jgi:hypothetical protein
MLFMELITGSRTAIAPFVFASMSHQEKSPSRSRVPVRQPAPDITTVLLQTVRQARRWNLDELVRACPQFTWSQIFREIDHLSRMVELRLTLSEGCRYLVAAPTDAASRMAQSAQRSA